MMTTRRLGVVALFGLMIAGWLIAWSPTTTGQAPADKPRLTWEYKTAFGKVGQPNDDELNQLGKEGWELMHFTAEEAVSAVRFVFRRPKAI